MLCIIRPVLVQTIPVNQHCLASLKPSTERIRQFPHLGKAPGQTRQWVLKGGLQLQRKKLAPLKTKMMAGRRCVVSGL
jgi:hypothetical protein